MAGGLMYLFEIADIPVKPKSRVKPFSRGYSSFKDVYRESSWVDEVELKYAKQQAAEARWKREQKRQKIADELREEKFRSLDHGYHSHSPISPRIKGLISELQGDVKGSYRMRVRDPHGKDVPADLRVDVARAMILSESRFGLFDEISANLTEDVLKDFTDWDSVLFSISSRGGYFTWDQLTNDPLTDHFRPGREFYSEDDEPVGRDSVILELKLKKGSVKLFLEVTTNGSGLRWRTRGSSMLKSAHKKLVADLNDVLEDYSNRLDWVREYREAPSLPGYTASEVERVGNSIKHFYKEQAPGLDFLKAGVYLGDQFTAMDDREARIYPVRCMSCQRAVDLEAVSDLDGSKRWTGSGVKDGLHISEIIPKPARPILRSLHSASGCKDSEAVSARTGKLVDLKS